MPAVLGQGVYSISEAAKLTGLKPGRVREWFRGRGSETGRNGVFAGDYEPVEGDFAISFHDLIDVYVGGQLREHGVSLPTVRKVYARMKQDLGTDHPFCRVELRTDGRRVFTHGLDGRGREELTEVLSRQGVFPQILLPFLKRLDYDNAKLLARRWRIAEAVVIDPSIAFGKPIIEAAGVPTAVLAAAYQANAEDAELVARWYGVTPALVRAAVEFERRLAA